MTTIGYGDVTPNHSEGRVIATVVMLAGIGFIPADPGLDRRRVRRKRRRVRAPKDNEVLETLTKIEARLARLEAERDDRR